MLTLFTYVSILISDFHKIGGFEIFHSCTHYERSPEVRSLVLELVATLVQNNPYCQAAVIESGFFPEMLKILDNDEEAAVKIKALYAASCKYSSTSL